ncbi:MAG: hypothetical protein L0312_10490, partial [Acidobacteria bacterium]|nr:hypothetical protein [Acidobacteriota bacterium]
VGKSLSEAQVSPNLDYALGIVSEEAVLVLVELNQGTEVTSVHQLPELGTGISRFALSSEGKAAALFYSETNTLRILSGLPSSIALGEPVDLSFLTGPLQTLTVSEDGNLVLLSAADGSVSRLYAYSKETGARVVSVMGEISAVQLFENGRDALVADKLTSEVFLMRDLLGTAQRTPLASQQEGISGPVALAFSKDGRQAFVANAGSGTVAGLDLSGGPAVLTSCHCTPTTLERLEGDSVFRLTDLSEDPLLMLESSPAENRILFVPSASGQSVSRRLPERGQSRSVRVPRRNVEP